MTYRNLLPLWVAWIPIAAGAAAPPAAQQPPAATPDDAVVATWKGGEVRRSQLDGWLRFHRLDDDPEELRSRIESMLLVETLADAALARGAGERTDVKVALAGSEERILLGALKRARRERIEIGDEEIAAAMREHPDHLERPRKVRLRHITKHYPPDAGPAEKAEVRRRMEAVRGRLEEGAELADLARSESDSQSRFHRGLIGNVPAGQLRPELDRVAMALAPGEISRIIESADGLTILECESVLDAFEPTREEVRQSLATQVRGRRVREDREDFEAALLTGARPRLDLEAARGTGDDAVVARFAGGRASRAELRESLRSGPVARDVDELDDEALRLAIEKLVVRKLGAGRARELGLDGDPEVAERVAWQHRQILAGDELRRLIDLELEPLEEAEVRAYYEAHRQSFRRLPHYRLSVIRIDLPPGDELGTYRRAEEIHRRLAAGELDFARAAREHSAHFSAADGGALGWLSRRQVAGFGGLVQRIVDGLAAGETSELLQQDRSLFILRVHEREEGRPLSFEESAEVAEQRLGSERLEGIRNRLEPRLAAALEVEVLP